MSTGCLVESSANGSDHFLPWTLDDVEQSIGQRFAEQVLRSPERLAVKSGNDAWTYRELDAQANQIAHALIARTGSANEPVAILYQQGAPLIAAILGALKAGKIYVPLDPYDPDSRLTGIISAAQPAAILCDDANAGRTRTIAGTAEVIVHAIDTADYSAHYGESPAMPDTLAYIFYTSGSTGEPKGVVDNHRNVLHNVLRYTNNLRICADDRLTLIQSCAFSGSVSSLFSAILNGASSFPFDLKRSGSARLARLINDESITMYHSVPSIFRDVAQHADSFPSVRTVRLEGDRAEIQDVDIFRRHFSDTCELAIGLGATETGLSCQHICGNGTPLPSSAVPIGLPAPGISVRVVGDAGDEVPAGTAGELVLRSRFLAVGYWNRPDLTEAAFASNGKDGVREFRTGDIGRINSDGLVEYLGRKDHRLKIGGNSVEPAVVEQALLATGFVREAVVASRIDPAGQSRLIAWIVSDRSTFSAADARRALAGKLPTWMIPSRIIAVASMPVSSNGKLDRKQLPDPWTEASSRVEKSAPSSDLEQIIAGTWREVLGAEDIGIDDDFFELGGDSLSATRILVAIEEALGRTFLSTDILDAPTIRELAAAIENDEGNGRESAIACLQPDGEKAPVFFIHPASGDVLFYRTLAEEMGTARPFYAIQSAAVYEDSAPDLTRLAERYIEQMKTIQPDGPYYLGGFCFGAYMALEMAHRLELEGESVAALFVVDTDGEEGLVNSLRDAVAIHVRRLSRMPNGDRVRYLNERIRYRLDRLRVQTWSWIARRVARSGRRVTPSMRRTALHEAHFQACGRRADVRWNGRVTYIQPFDRGYVDPLSYWAARTDGVDVLEVSASHATLFRKPDVRSVAMRISATLDAATCSVVPTSNGFFVRQETGR